MSTSASARLAMIAPAARPLVTCCAKSLQVKKTGSTSITEVRLADALVPSELRALALDRHLPDLQHVRTRRRVERDVRILLDDEGGQPVLRVQLLHDAEELLHDRRREPQRRLVEHKQARSRH